MKIAVPVTYDKLVDTHFGHCDSYAVYSLSETNEIVEVNTIKSPAGCGCKSDIAPRLASFGVSVMLAGGIGVGAVNVLNNNGIEVIKGCSGRAEEVVRKYIEGSVEDSGSTCDHHHSHSPGEHTCHHG
ncbi:MAG TPA: NifB/NifX family molybdenum-iron cluster-binding protein [Bacteroidales bacterium]|nr:NifB/NifX family molybdenum-iron cluster-binding protein [Bacteroidales bacterium]